MLQITNQVRQQLLPFIFTNEEPDTEKKIEVVAKEGIEQIKTYFSEHPATLDDLIFLELLKDDLSEINQNISDLITPIIKNISDIGINKAFFKAEPSLKDQVRYFFASFKDFFIGSIQKNINKQIFYVWNQKLRYESNWKKIERLRNEINQLQSQITKQGNETLEFQLTRAQTALAKAEMFAEEYEKNRESGRATRNLLTNVGGTEVILQTKDHEKLDAVYLKADHFRKKCIEASAKSVKIEIPLENETLSFSGLLFTDQQLADPFISSLDKLKIFQETYGQNKGAGWAKIQFKDQVGILPDFEVEQLLKNGIINEKNGIYHFSSKTLLTMKVHSQPLEMDAQKSGTIVLGMGAAGIYEMYKREALALLLQGVNVMLFNHRGQGESTGKPSEEGTYEDMETVYSYLKEVHHTEDHQIVLRRLCLSGGIVSKLASTHPKVHVILDQTYADISDIAYKTVLDTLKDLLHYSSEQESQLKSLIIAGLSPLLNIAVSLFTPNFVTAKNLSGHEGEMVILRTTEDTYIDGEMTNKLVDQILEGAPAERVSQITMGEMPGIHGATWLDAKETFGDNHTVYSGRAQLFSFLNKCGVLNLVVTHNF
jgi:hypothetical protein